MIHAIKNKLQPFLKIAVAAAIGLASAGLRPAEAQAPANHTVRKYDVVVIGSEIQGMLLAKAARDGGLKVLVIDPREQAGGELLQGRMFYLDDVHDNTGQSLVQGEIKRLFRGYKKGRIRTTADFTRYYTELTKGISVRSGTILRSLDTRPGTQKSGRTLYALTCKDPSGASYTLRARYWVDNTDFAALASRLGEPRIPGMESLYRGSKQPDYMAATYMLSFRQVHWEQLRQDVLSHYPLTNVRKKYGSNTYVDRSFATGFSFLTKGYRSTNSRLKLRGLNIVNQKNGIVTVNGLLIYDVDPSSEASVESAIRCAQAEAPLIRDYLRGCLPGFAKAELHEAPPYLYIRDFNRYATKYVLCETDVNQGAHFWDNVSLGGYPIDLQGTRAIPIGIGFGKPDRYGVPLRSFQLKSYDNVLVAGKNIGADIKAYGSARIMPTTALAAQTMGIILAREQTPLDQLTRADFVRIHRYLKAEYGIDVR